MKYADLTNGSCVEGTIDTIFAAVAQKDDIEGRGGTYDKSYHLTREDALIASKGLGVMGQDGTVRSCRVLRLKDEYVLLPDHAVTVDATADAEAKAALREEALAKLSDAERAALLGCF